jgi:hypothetical protein
MIAGMIDLGHDDVVDKIMRDFTKHGISITRGQVLVQLSKERRCVTTLSYLNESRRPADGKYCPNNTLPPRTDKCNPIICS